MKVKLNTNSITAGICVGAWYNQNRYFLLKTTIQTFIIVKNGDIAVYYRTIIDLRFRGANMNRDGLITFINGVLDGVEGDAVNVRRGAKVE